MQDITNHESLAIEVKNGTSMVVKDLFSYLLKPAVRWSKARVIIKNNISQRTFSIINIQIPLLCCNCSTDPTYTFFCSFVIRKPILTYFNVY